MTEKPARSTGLLLYQRGIKYLFLSFFLQKNCATIATVPTKATEVNNYHIPLIREVYDRRGTCGIILLSADNCPSFELLTVWHEISGMLSADGIPTVMMSFNEFDERFKFYARQTPRPLVVIIFQTMDEVHSFSKIVRELGNGYAVWLVLFIGDFSWEICNYCYNPHGNLLNLRYNSEVIISCCGSNIIQEWWSTIKGRSNKLEVGRWIDEDVAFEWFFQESLYSRRHSMDGQEFRIAAVEGSVYFREKNGNYYGFLGEILRELSESLNFTIPSINWGTSYGSSTSETSNWTGVIGKLEQDEADMGVSEFRMTNERLNVIDYTVPIAVGGAQLYSRKLDSARVHWNAYFKAFAFDVWMAIVGLILVIPIFLTIIKYQRKRHYLLSLALEHYSSIWGIYCQQGLSALVSSGAYSASLISFLAVSSSYSPFNTLEQFVEDGSYELIVLKDSPDYKMYKNSNQPLMKKMMARMKPEEFLPRTYQEGFEQVCTKRVVFYTHEAIRRAMVDLIPCEITSVYTGKTETLGMILPRGSEYKGLINYQIRRFGDNGMVQRLSHKYFTESYRNELTYPSVHLQGIVPILSMLAAGFLIASVIFMVERTFYPDENHVGSTMARVSEEMLNSSRKRNFVKWNQEKKHQVSTNNCLDYRKC